MTDAARLTLWEAMSELFLDTEVRPEIPRVALACCVSGYDDARLTHIFVHEVAPLLSHNLMSVAGEWAGWPREWLAARLREKPYPPSRAQRFWARLRVLPRRDWELTLVLVAHLRPLPEGQRALRTQGLSYLMRAYFFELTPARPPEIEAAATLSSVFTNTLQARLPAQIYPSVETLRAPDGEARVERALALLASERGGSG